MDNNEQKSLNQIIDFRIKKIDEFRNDDINPYPYKFKKDLNIDFINKNEEKLNEKNISNTTEKYLIKLNTYIS